MVEISDQHFLHGPCCNDDRQQPTNIVNILQHFGHIMQLVTNTSLAEEVVEILLLSIGNYCQLKQ